MIRGFWKIAVPAVVTAGLGLGAIVGNSVAVLAQEESNSVAPALLQAPPKLDYGRICKADERPLPLALDWKGWKGEEPDVSADRMLADAARLVDGGNDVYVDRGTARRLLEYMASGTTTAAPEAKRQLALLLLDARSGESDAARAEQLLIEASAAQHTNAAMAIGKLMRRGALPHSSPQNAAHYLGIAAGLGNPSAALELAAMYAAPGAALPFPDAARHFATLAAINVHTALAAGDCNIAADVGEYLIETNPVQGAEQAAAWFEIGASSQDARAMARLARFHEAAKGEAGNLDKARLLWDRAATTGLVRAMAPAARLWLADGRDLPHAVELLKLGMANGDAESYLLAARYYRGDYTGKADFAAMLETLNAAAAQPDASVFALDMLANAYLTGQGLPTDRQRADALYRRILATGLPEAQALYGRYLMNNRLGLRAAATYLEAASANGSTAAKYQLAELAACTIGSSRNADALIAEAADAGSSAALRRLARHEMDGGNHAASVGYLRRAMALGDRLAMVELAALSVQGGGAGDEDAEKLIAQAAALGADVTEGRLALAIAYRSGRLGEDRNKGEALLSSLAESRQAAVDVEIIRPKLLGGALSESDQADVSNRLQSAADGGNPEAMLLLSRYEQANGERQEIARDWLIAAAERGDATAMAELPRDAAIVKRVLAGLRESVICSIPVLVQRARLHRQVGETAEAADVLELAERIAARRPRDIHILADAYAEEGPDAPRDFAKAARLYERSAVTGYGKSALALANLYAGRKLGEHDSEAIKWLKAAAIAGETQAIRGLSRFAERGPAVASANLGLTALQQVAEQDNAAAMQAYGALLVLRGAEHYAEGIRFLEKAAARGDVLAMKSLARLYAAGIDGKVSADESTRWTRMAAESGDPEAMFQYAMALDLGFGVAVDQKSAKSWHQKAKQNGFVR